MAAWRFYVYAIGEADNPSYIGKGSGGRLRAQCRNFKSSGYEIARFKRENDAYAFERAAIAEQSPPLNRCAGGNGSRAKPKRAPRREAWEIEMQAIGSRRYAARFLLSRDIRPYCTPSEIDAIRRVAHG